MSGSFCPGCGRPTASDARFCAGCGRALERAASAAAPTKLAAPKTAADAEETIYDLKPVVVRTGVELLLCIVTLGIWFVWLWLSRLGVRYVVSNQRIETRTGVFTRRRESLEIFRIEDFEVVEPFWLRMLGAGHITIWSMDKDDPVLTLEAIPHVQEIYEKLRTLTREERDRRGVRVLETG